MLTGDLNVIDVQWIVQYRIEDPVRYLFEVREQRETLRDVAEAVMRRVLQTHTSSLQFKLGFKGFGRIPKTMSIFQSEHTGYAIVVGRKPFAGTS